MDKRRHPLIKNFPRNLIETENAGRVEPSLLPFFFFGLMRVRKKEEEEGGKYHVGTFFGTLVLLENKKQYIVR